MENDRRVIDLSVEELKSILSTSVSEPSEIMDVESCAKLLKKEMSTIYQYVSRKTIPFKKKNGSVYFLRSEILDWIKDGER